MILNSQIYQNSPNMMPSEHPRMSSASYTRSLLVRSAGMVSPRAEYLAGYGYGIAWDGICESVNNKPIIWSVHFSHVHPLAGVLPHFHIGDMVFAHQNDQIQWIVHFHYFQRHTLPTFVAKLGPSSLPIPAYPCPSLPPRSNFSHRALRGNCAWIREMRNCS